MKNSVVGESCTGAEGKVYGVCEKCVSFHIEKEILTVARTMVAEVGLGKWI